MKNYNLNMKPVLLIIFSILVFMGCGESATEESKKKDFSDSIAEALNKQQKRQEKAAMETCYETDETREYKEIVERVSRTSLTIFPKELIFKLHIIYSSKNKYLKKNVIDDAIKYMNSIFKNSKISFNLIEKSEYTDNFTLDTIRDFSDKMDILYKKYNKRGFINLYILATGFESGLRGQTPSPLITLSDESLQNRNADAVFIGDIYMTNRKTLCHEMGHFFCLYHTDKELCGSSSEERANGSNCKETGDCLCDTPADPQNQNGLLMRTSEYRDDILDKDGTPFHPPINNFMSYYDICGDYIFTPMQYKIIRYIAENNRKYLLKK